MGQNFSTLTFTDSVKAAQTRYGARENWDGEENEPDRFYLTQREIPFIQSTDGFYMATVGENGWPYMQFRGGPNGFLKILDPRTLGYADFRGNKQYISTGNIASQKKAMLFLMDYPNRQRLKIWTMATITDVADDPALAKKLVMPDYRGKVERLVVLTIQAYDWNCPQHITPRYTEKAIIEKFGNGNSLPS